jgi:hypothetical protein
MLEGRKISFKHTQKCEPYKSEDGKQYLETKEVVIHDGLVIDKYRGTPHKIDGVRDVWNYALVDFYLVLVNHELYHVLPTDIVGIN